MKFKLSIAVSLLVIAVFTGSPLFAQNSVTLTPSKDNTLYEDAAGALSNGAGKHLFAGKSGLDLRRRALLAFDVTGSIPTDAVLDSVHLTLTMSRTISGPETLVVHRVTGDWGEGASAGTANEGQGAPAMATDATWLHTFYDTSTWSSPGGDFSPDSSAVFEADSAGVYVVSSNILADDVKGWLANPEENFGWILIGDETKINTAKRFNSRENDDAVTHPRLEVFYSMATASENLETPQLMRVYPNYPNPFSKSTTVTFDLDRPAVIQLDVFDVLGRRVWGLPARSYSAGFSHRIMIEGAQLVAGVYFYRLTAVAGPGMVLRVSRSIVVEVR